MLQTDMYVVNMEEQQEVKGETKRRKEEEPCFLHHSSVLLHSFISTLLLPSSLHQHTHFEGFQYTLTSAQSGCHDDHNVRKQQSRK